MPATSDDSPKVSSAVIFDQLQLLRETYGAPVVDRAIASLPSSLREEVALLAPGTWISVDAARETKNAVARLVAVDPLELQRRLSASGVERTLNTFWRFFLRRLGDEALSKRTPLLYARTFNSGSLTLAAWEEGAAELELRGWRIPDYDLAGLMAGIARVLELAGRRDVELTATRKGASVRLRATWPRR